jgi:hypothetical protein
MRRGLAIVGVRAFVRLLDPIVVPLLPGLRAIVEGWQPDTSRWSWSRWRIPLSPTEGRPQRTENAEEGKTSATL